MKKFSIAVLTNFAFTIVGIAMLFLHRALLPTGVFVVLLSIESGLHHYYDTYLTRRLDYLGMFTVLISAMLMMAGLSNSLNIILTAAIGIGIVKKFGPSRVILGILLGLSFLTMGAVLWNNVSPYFALRSVAEISFITAIGYMFNFIGDHIHEPFHSTIHGIGWHVVISWGLLRFSEVIIFALYKVSLNTKMAATIQLLLT